MASSAAPGKTVLIADDTPFVRERFMAALEGAGHRATFARSAAELLARVRADLEDIDLLLVDLKLPHQSGAELIRAVRKLDGGRLPILVFSGTVSERRGSARAGRARGQRLHQRVQRRPAHLAVAGAAPVS